MTYIFESLINPILVYGSDVWGVNANGTAVMDKLCMWYLRRILNVKATTSNLIVLGECGVLPPSVQCHVKVLTYYKRLQHLSESTVVKKVFDELCRLRDMGFNTWTGKVCELAENCDVDQFKKICKFNTSSQFKSTWYSNIHNFTDNPLLRTYQQFKTTYEMEPYLQVVANTKFRSALSRFRASSHNLAIEKGRYTNPKTPVEHRLCHFCNVIENEEHFVMDCIANSNLRKVLFAQIAGVDNSFCKLSKHQKFLLLLQTRNEFILSWFGKYLFKSFNNRNKKMLGVDMSHVSF